MKLVNKVTGECFSPRCRATNLCPYCRMMAVLETAEMHLLDARSGDAPTHLLTLTANTFPTGAELRRTADKIVRGCRRPTRWTGFEWFLTRERQVRGVQHLHALIKHVPTDEDSTRQLYEVITRIWCERHRAEAHPYEERANGPQGLKLITDVEGVVNYLAKDLTESLKSKQALEIGYQGHRTSQTRGYFAQGTTAAREAAQESLRRRRMTWLLEEQGVAPDQMDAAIEAAIAESENLEFMVMHHGVLRGVEELRNPFQAVGRLPVRPRRRTEPTPRR
jgi:hypothetical protein